MIVTAKEYQAMVPVECQGVQFMVEKNRFEQMVYFRNERIREKVYYNDGQYNTDPFAERGIELKPNGQVTMQEIGVVCSNRLEYDRVKTAITE